MANTLTGTSTIADIKTQYMNSAAYDVLGSVEMAHDFLVACRALLVRLPKKVGLNNRAEESEWDPTVIEHQILDCRRWLYSNQAQQPATIRVFNRGDGFAPMYPGPYYG